jgi:hypothetical protein
MRKLSGARRLFLRALFVDSLLLDIRFKAPVNNLRNRPIATRAHVIAVQFTLIVARASRARFRVVIHRHL